MATARLGIVDVERCIHPLEKSRFWLAVGIVVPVTLFYILVTQTMGLIIVPILIFFAWVSTRLYRATLLGSCAQVSPDNFGEIQELLDQICLYLDYPKKIETYVFQNGDVNAFVVSLFRTRIILLPHELLAETLDGSGRTELIWVLARDVGHLKAKHLKLWWLNLLIEKFESLAFLNIFLYPWERATQYSGDRIGLAICSDLEAALGAMNKFMLGNKLAGRTTLVGALQQRQQLAGSFFGWLAECLSTHPHLTNRIASLIGWSRAYNPTLYEHFMRKQPDRLQIESLLQGTERLPVPVTPIASETAA